MRRGKMVSLLDGARKNCEFCGSGFKILRIWLIEHGKIVYLVNEARKNCKFCWAVVGKLWISLIGCWKITSFVCLLCEKIANFVNLLWKKNADFVIVLRIANFVDRELKNHEFLSMRHEKKLQITLLNCGKIANFVNKLRKISRFVSLLRENKISRILLDRLQKNHVFRQIMGKITNVVNWAQKILQNSSITHGKKSWISFKISWIRNL